MTRNITFLHKNNSADNSGLYHDLYKRFYADIFRFLMRLSVPDSEISDLIHEVFLRVYHMDNLEKLDISPRAYLCKIALNLVRDNYRKKKNIILVDPVHYEIETTKDNAPGPEHIISKRQALNKLKGAISELEPKRRKILLMNRINCLSTHEISSDLNIPLRTVQRYLKEALAYCHTKVEESR